MLLFTSCYWFKFEFCFSQRSLRTVKIGHFVIFVINRYLFISLNGETSDSRINSTDTGQKLENCHSVFRPVFGAVIKIVCVC